MNTGQTSRIRGKNNHNNNPEHPHRTYFKVAWQSPALFPSFCPLALRYLLVSSKVFFNPPRHPRAVPEPRLNCSLRPIKSCSTNSPASILIARAAFSRFVICRNAEFIFFLIFFFLYATCGHPRMAVICRLHITSLVITWIK